MEVGGALRSRLEANERQLRIEEMAGKGGSKAFCWRLEAERGKLKAERGNRRNHRNL